MRWLIRRVTRKGKGSVAYEEDIHYGDVLTVGRGSDQAIFVPDLRYDNWSNLNLGTRGRRAWTTSISSFVRGRDE